jgi:beta-xylosidase
MYNSVSTEIIARGKVDEDKAWREKQAERFKELGREPPKVYMVLGRETGRVFVEWEGFNTWQEVEEMIKVYSEDEELQKLEVERAEKGMVVEGSNEVFILTDY